MIRLSPEQQAILSGASGPYLAKCMRWLVDWGEAMGATRLIPVDNTHVLLPVPNLVARGASKQTIEHFVRNLKEACSHRTNSRCICTVHTLFVSMDDLDVPENDPEQVRMQREITELATAAGFIPTFTCAPLWSAESLD